MSSHLISFQFISSHVPSSQGFSPHLTSPHLTSSHLISCFSLFGSPSQLFPSLLMSSEFFSAPRFYRLFTTLLLSALLRFCQFFSHFLNSSQLFSAHLMFSHLFSPLLTSSKLFSALLTSSQLIPQLLSTLRSISALFSSPSDHLSSSVAQNLLQSRISAPKPQKVRF